MGECLFAQSQLRQRGDRAYEAVEKLDAQGDRVPAALWKLALSREKLGQDAKARKVLEDLVRRFPLSGEAQLAKDRLGRSQGPLTRRSGDRAGRVRVAGPLRSPAGLDGPRGRP